MGIIMTVYQKLVTAASWCDGLLKAAQSIQPKCLLESLHKHAVYAGGRYDGLLKAAWQQAGLTSSPPPAAVGLTLNADRLTLLASAPKAKGPPTIPHLSQVSTLLW